MAFRRFNIAIVNSNCLSRFESLRFCVILCHDQDQQVLDHSKIFSNSAWTLAPVDLLEVPSLLIARLQFELEIYENLNSMKEQAIIAYKMKGQPSNNDAWLTIYYLNA